MAVEKGNKVKVDYEGTLEDGTVFDTSKGKAPIEFEVGEGKVIKGFDDGVLGMNVGEDKELKIPAAEAYGEPNPALEQVVPREKFNLPQEPKVDMMVMLGAPDGRQIPARIKEVTDKEISLDMNHPLAGKNLTFKIKLVEIN